MILKDFISVVVSQILHQNIVDIVSSISKKNYKSKMCMYYLHIEFYNMFE
jgi:hypothetical protein